MFMLKLNTNINFILFLDDFWKRGEYELRVPKFTVCFFECARFQEEGAPYDK
jgi:hypothetical protein